MLTCQINILLAKRKRKCYFEEENNMGETLNLMVNRRKNNTKLFSAANKK